MKDLVAIGYANGIIRLYKGQSGENWQQIPHPLPIVDIDFSSDGKQLAFVDSNGKLQIWNIESGQIRTSVDVEPRSVSNVMFSKDGKNLLGLQGSEVACWKLKI